MSEKKERDWVKEPYNTWDTLAAMRIPPLPADKHDIEALLARIEKIEDMLVELIAIIKERE